MQKRLLGWACALLFVGAAHAQSAGVVNLSVTPTSGTGSVTPRLTWSTNPTAQSCTASGGWSGTKAASGSQTLSAISGSTNYTLTCRWGTGSAVVSWVAPTRNTDGTALTDLSSFRVLYGTSSTSFTRTANVTDPTARTTTIGSLTPATWYFKVRVVNSSGVESGDSNVATKAVTGATAARTVNVTVNPASGGGGLTTNAVNVWDVKTKADGTLAINQVVGWIALGKPCDSSYRVGASHYRVNRSDATKIYITPISSNVVVSCGSGTPLTTKAVNVWDVKTRSDGTLAINQVVGWIALGKPCDASYKVGTSHYRVNRSDATKIYITPISSNVVVNCVGD